MSETKERVLEQPDDTEASEAASVRSPLAFIPLKGRAADIRDWVGVVAGVYLLITAVKIIGSGFQIATGDQADQLFAFADNPLVALMVGLLATALTQSSSTTTSVTVGLVAGGMPMEVAIPMLMGANMGTTMTNTLVSLGMARDKQVFRRAFAAATVHDFFNLLAVVILLPLELMFGILNKSAGWLAEQTSGGGGGLAVAFGAFGDFISGATESLYNVVNAGLGVFGMHPIAQGAIMIVLGVALILLVINKIGQLLKRLMVGKAKQVLHTAIGRGPISGIASGTVITVMVQSSSTTTSLAVPLAGSGAFSLRQIYPFTIGCNIGTTITAVIAAFGFSGGQATLALHAAFVHMLFNVFAALIIFGLPFLRSIPPRGAEILAKFSAEKKIYAVVWTFGVFLVLPLVLIAVTSWLF